MELGWGCFEEHACDQYFPLPFVGIAIFHETCDIYNPPLAWQERQNCWYLLNEREQQLVRQLDFDFHKRFKKSPESDPDLIYFLGDRYEWARTWSAGSKPVAIPTYRKNAAKYLQRSTMRMMTAADKLCSLGWPIANEVARETGCTKMPCLDPQRSSQMAGNSMHLSVASIVLLVGMSCFGKVGWVSSVSRLYLALVPDAVAWITELELGKQMSVRNELPKRLELLWVSLRLCFEGVWDSRWMDICFVRCCIFIHKRRRRAKFELIDDRLTCSWFNRFVCAATVLETYLSHFLCVLCDAWKTSASIVGVIGGWAGQSEIPC